jgi:hypothetical protein
MERVMSADCGLRSMPERIGPSAPAWASQPAPTAVPLDGTAGAPAAVDGRAVAYAPAVRGERDLDSLLRTMAERCRASRASIRSEKGTSNAKLFAPDTTSPVNFTLLLRIDQSRQGERRLMEVDPYSRPLSPSPSPSPDADQASRLADGDFERKDVSIASPPAQAASVRSARARNLLLARRALADLGDEELERIAHRGRLSADAQSRLRAARGGAAGCARLR